MKARPVEYALAAVAVLMLVLLAVLRQADETAAAPSVYSTYDTGPNGYRALYDVLHAAGVPATRFEHMTRQLTSGTGTLVLSTFAGDLSALQFRPSDVAALRRFVQRGGRLVALDDDFEGKFDITPGIGTSTRTNARGAVALARDRDTAGVRRVRVPIDALFLRKWRGSVPLLGNRRGIAALRYPFGKGEVVAITAPALFSNAALARADNARFAYNVLAGRGPVAFDEYVHGYDDDASFWSVLPPAVHAAVWLAGAIVLLGVVGANLPFAPPIPAEPPDERDTAAYIDAMAALLRRARAARAAIDVFAASARRGRAIGAAAEAARAQLERLNELPYPSDTALLEAAGLEFRLRKDIG